MVAADEQFRAFVRADLHVVVHLGALAFVDERTDIGFGLEPVAQLQGFGARDQHLGEFLHDLFVDDDAAAGGAPLAGGAERAEDDAFDRKSRSASSITIMAFLPPISSEYCFMFFAQEDAMTAPVSVDPVKETRSTLSCSVMGVPTSVPEPVTRFNTPGGSPACSKILTKLTTDSGVSVAGLMTTVLPQTSAGTSFQDGMAMGKFHGVMAETIPTGMRTDMQNLFLSSEGTVSPSRSAAFPGGVVGEVDGFLHVAAGFADDLAHFAGHVLRQDSLLLQEQFGDLEQRFPRAWEREWHAILGAPLRPPQWLR